MEKEHFAILRFDKLRTSGQVGEAMAHHLRTSPVPNADPSRTHMNRVLIGSADAAEVVRRVGETPARRKDAVRAMGFMATATPEFFETTAKDKKTQDAWATATAAWFKKEFGVNVIFGNLQYDEKTLHMQGVIIPVDETGRLNARKIFSKPNLARMQTEYAKAVEHLGLKRGVEHSTAEHTKIKAFYAALKKTPAPVKLPGLPELPGKLDRMSDEKLAAWADGIRKATAAAIVPALKNEAAAAAAGRVAVKQSDTIRRNAAKEVAKEKRNADTYKTRWKEEKEKADMHRDVTLLDVVDALGMMKEKAGVWKSPDGRKYGITPHEGLFNCFDTQNGGKGAVSLVEHVLQCSRGQAFGWIRKHFGDTRTAATVARPSYDKAMKEVKDAKPIDFVMPPSLEEKWPDVRRYLTEKRGLDPKFVDDLHEQGMLYASAIGKYTNATFLSMDAEFDTPAGAHLRGIEGNYKAASAGTKKDKGPAFAYPMGAWRDAQRVAVVESAIDAIAYYQLEQKAGRAQGLAVVASGGDGQAGIMRALALNPRCSVVLAQDADADGDKQAEALKEALEGRKTTRHRPAGAKDWGELVMAAKGGGQGFGVGGESFGR